MLTPLLLTTLKGSVLVLILAIGMDATTADLTYIFRRPALLVRSIVAMYVLVPLAVLILIRLLTLPPAVEVALLVLAVSAGGLLLPRRLLDVGDGDYVFSLVVLSSLLAIVLVPVWLVAIESLAGYSAELQPGAIARVLGRFFLLPLVIGMVLRRFLPDPSRRLSKLLLTFGGAVLTLCVLALLVANARVILEIGWAPLLTFGAVTLLALAVGHLLGGPQPEDRTVLAIACATRHIGLMVLVAASVPGPRVAALVGAYLLASALITIPYLRWRRVRLSGSTVG